MAYSRDRALKFFSTCASRKFFRDGGPPSVDIFQAGPASFTVRLGRVRRLGSCSDHFSSHRYYLYLILDSLQMTIKTRLHPNCQVFTLPIRDRNQPARFSWPQDKWACSQPPCPYRAGEESTRQRPYCRNCQLSNYQT